jgi:hypothetical protein
MSLTGQSSATMTEAELGAKAQLERWLKGLPVREATATASSNLAVISTLASAADPRGWAPDGSGTLP